MESSNISLTTHSQSVYFTSFTVNNTFCNTYKCYRINERLTKSKAFKTNRQNMYKV